MDLADSYSHADLPLFKQSLRRKAFIYLHGGGASPVHWYREIMELMAPDVIVVPIVSAGPADAPEELCRELQQVAGEYARRMDFGWDEPTREHQT